MQKQLIASWQVHHKRIDKLIEKLKEEDWYKETAPGRNRGIYLLGHLIAINDAMGELLGAAPRKYAHLDEAFLKLPDNSGLPLPTVTELIGYWRELNERQLPFLESLTTAQWLEPHTAVSAADFALNPMRNKLNVFISRLTHEAYHLGQLVYL